MYRIKLLQGHLKFCLSPATMGKVAAGGGQVPGVEMVSLLSLFFPPPPILPIACPRQWLHCLPPILHAPVPQSPAPPPPTSHSLCLLRTSSALSHLLPIASVPFPALTVIRHSSSFIPSHIRSKWKHSPWPTTEHGPGPLLIWPGRVWSCPVPQEALELELRLEMCQWGGRGQRLQKQVGGEWGAGEEAAGGQTWLWL